MDLVSDRGRRVSVDELNTTRLLAHARQQAHQRKLDDVLIVDVDAHHYEMEHMGEIVPFMENDVLRQLSLALGKGRARHQPAALGDRLSGHGRPRHALSAALIGKDRARQDPRRAARRALDGRHGGRLLLPVSQPACSASARIRRRRWKSSCAGPIAAGSPKRCCRIPDWPPLFDAQPAVLRSGRRACVMSSSSATARA